MQPKGIMVTIRIGGEELLISLDVISLVASGCRYYRGHIEPRAAHEFAVPLATQRGLAKRIQHYHPPRAARCARAGASLQTSTAAPEAWHRSGTLARSGTPRWRTREEQRPHRL